MQEENKPDGRKNNGKHSKGGGAPKKDPLDVKKTVPFQIKLKHVDEAKRLIKPIIDALNNS